MARKYAGTGLQEIRGRIEVVNYSTQRLVVKARGYGTLKKVKVQSGIQLGTTDRPVIVAGDIALLRRQPSGRWICYSILHKDRCATSTAEVIEVEVSTASSYIAQQASALETPLDLRYPPIEPLGQITLPEFRFPDPTMYLCGIPQCTNCAPSGYSAGMTLILSSDIDHPSGCWVWGFRQGVVGGILWVLSNESIWVIDSFISTLATSSSPGQSNLCLGYPQDALNLYAGSYLFSYLYQSLDGGLSFTQTLETHEASRENNPQYGTIMDFDRSYRARGYGVSFLSVLDDGSMSGGIREPIQSYVDAVLNQWYPPAAGTYALSVQETDLDYFFEGMTVYALISMNGGASWTEYALDNLGELIPSRIESVGYVIGQTQYESFGCVLTGSGNPIGIPAIIVEDAPPNSRLYFAVCSETYDPDDPESNGLPFVDFPNLVGLFCVAAKQDGNGCYVFVETMHIGPQTDLGEYQSPWSPNGGDPQRVWTQWIWEVTTSGSATRKEIALGSEYNASASFDGTDTLGNVRALQKAVVNPTDTNQIFALVLKHIGDPDTGDFYFGVDEIDFDFATMTTTSAPFESDATLDALDIVCVETGSVFVYVIKDDFSQASIWKWDGATWTETDVTTDVDSGGFVGGGRFTYSQADTKLYLVCDTQIVGETIDDGTTWTFTSVTGDSYSLTDVDTY